MALVYALTGSIGMGKSAVADMIRKLGVPLFDADAEVHRLQAPGGKALAQIEARFPGTTGPKGLDRAKLAAIILAHPHERKALEAIMHPLVFAGRQEFLRRHISKPLVILDIPLLFETHGQKRVDGVIVVTAPAWKQRKRVLARPAPSCISRCPTLLNGPKRTILSTPEPLFIGRAAKFVRSSLAFCTKQADSRSEVESQSRCAKSYSTRKRPGSIP
jgi:dephospho-CoA kinase